MAIIHPCSFKSKKYSVLLTEWHLEFTRNEAPQLDIVSVDTIQEHVFVIPDSDGVTIKTVTDVKEWASNFV
jgi:hypothetical protein